MKIMYNAKKVSGRVSGVLILIFEFGPAPTVWYLFFYFITRSYKIRPQIELLP